MSKRLLNTKDVVERLNVSRATFYRKRPKLIALGLKAVRVGRLIRYQEPSLEKAIDKATSEF